METIFGYCCSAIGVLADDAADESFALQIKSNINTSLGTLVQNGVGKNVDLISNPDATWSDFLESDEKNPAHAKQYVVVKLKLEFDAPLPSAVPILEKAAAEALWRARTEYDV